MVKYYRTDDRMIREVDKLDSGAWAYMVSPTTEEAQEIAERLDVDLGDIFAAVDKEESARIELEDGYTLILVDVPSLEMRHEKASYNRH